MHLPSMDYVRYEAGATLPEVLESSTAKHTMLIAWFDANSKHNDGRHLSYCDFPKERSWDASYRCWRKKQLLLKLAKCTMYILLSTNYSIYVCY
jgi:hypothetical protein